MRVIVIGAGAIGGWLAATLARGGAEVGLVARGATLTHLERTEEPEQGTGGDGIAGGVFRHQCEFDRFTGRRGGSRRHQLERRDLPAGGGGEHGHRSERRAGSKSHFLRHYPTL
jgi:choline dehydrogenase-like flavoprotein